MGMYIMGMYDSVYLRCPNCGTSISCQSNTVSCELLGCENEIPLKVAGDLIGTVKNCHVCYKNFKVCSGTKKVHLFLAEVE